MIQLKMNSADEEQFLRIQKDNHILVENEKGMIDFYNRFMKLIEGTEEFTGFIDYKKIDSKSFVLLNLLDYQVLNEAVQYKKGSLLFEYIDFVLKDHISTFPESINLELVSFLDKIFYQENLQVDYVVNEDSIKLLHNQVQFFLPCKSLEMQLEAIKEMLNSLFIHNLTKKYIIFYNSKIIDYDFSKYDCCYSFDVNQNKPFEVYNLMAIDAVREFNLNILKKEIELLWPIEYREEHLKKIIEKYFTQYLFLEEIKLSIPEEILVAHIIQKLLGIDKKLSYDSSILNYNIKSFLTKL